MVKRFAVRPDLRRPPNVVHKATEGCFPAPLVLSVTVNCVSLRVLKKRLDAIRGEVRAVREGLT